MLCEIPYIILSFFGFVINVMHGPKILKIVLLNMYRPKQGRITHKLIYGELLMNVNAKKDKINIKYVI